MSRIKLFRALGLALGVVIVLAAVGVVGFSMQRSTGRVHASGSGGGGGYCFVMTNATPTCHFSGFSAQAYYYSVDRSTCANGVYTYYGVYAADNVQVDPSTSTVGGPLVSVFTSMWNNCTYSYSSYYGQTTNASIKTTGTLDTATAQATIQTQDWNHNPGPTVTVDMKWVGFGSTTTLSDMITQRTGDTMYKSHVTGSSRQAMGDGTLTIGTTPVTISSTTVMYDASGGDILIEHA